MNLAFPIVVSRKKLLSYIQYFKDSGWPVEEKISGDCITYKTDQRWNFGTIAESSMGRLLHTIYIRLEDYHDSEETPHEARVPHGQ